MSVTDEAHRLIGLGYRVVPVVAREKGPRVSGWQRLTIDAGEVERHFAEDSNLGVILGEPSGWLIDVDLDCAEAVGLADKHLPHTDAVTGRPGRPRSHRWYIAPGLTTTREKDERGTIAELRSTGAQTLVGPSVHPSGETYDRLEGRPAEVDGADLEEAFAALVAECRRLRGGAARPPEPTTPFDLAGDKTISRAVAYLARLPEAISGQGGHDATYRAASALVHGFALDPDLALGILLRDYNPRCVPEWTEHELRHKVNDAATKGHREPRGYLRDRPEPQRIAAADLPRPGPSRNVMGTDAFPAHLMDVPGLIGEVIEHNLATARRKQPVLALGGAVCLQSVICGRKVMASDRTRANINIVGVAPSSKGKDHARAVNQDILTRAGLELYEGAEDLTSGSALESAMVAQQALLMQIDEFGMMLEGVFDKRAGGHQREIARKMMQLYSSAGKTYTGKAYADPAKTKRIHQPHLVIMGTTTPETLFKAIGAAEADNGFIGRMVYLSGDRAKAERRVRYQRPSDSIIDTVKWWGAMNTSNGNIVDLNPEPNIVPISEDADDALFEFGRMADDRGEQPGQQDAIWGRCQEQATKLALIYACSADPYEPVIDTDAAAWGMALAEYSAAQVQGLIARYSVESDTDRVQKKIVRALERHGSLRRSDLVGRIKGEPRHLWESALKTLIEAGDVVESVVRQPEKSGPDPIYYSLAEAG